MVRDVYKVFVGNVLMGVGGVYNRYWRERCVGRIGVYNGCRFFCGWLKIFVFLLRFEVVGLEDCMVYVL